MAETKIDWTDRVWNPVTGCSKVSPGCLHCYAERMAKRLAGRAGYPKDDPFRVTCHENRLDMPLRWRKPSRVFVNSMSDLFHEDVPDSFMDRVFAVIALTGRHTYQVLTKRADRLLRYATDPETPKRIGKYMNVGTILLINGNLEPDGGTMARWFQHGAPWPLPNVHIGVTAENQAMADDRIGALLQVPAAVRFVSVEPCLGPVDVSDYLPGGEIAAPCYGRGLDWVIAGSESGPGRRPAELDWFRSLRDQCSAAGVPFFLKQINVDGRLEHSPELDGRQWREFPNGSS